MTGYRSAYYNFAFRGAARCGCGSGMHRVYGHVGGARLCCSACKTDAMVDLVKKSCACGT